MKGFFVFLFLILLWGEGIGQSKGLLNNSYRKTSGEVTVDASIDLPLGETISSVIEAADSLSFNNAQGKMQKVFSEKLWRQHADSLAEIPSVNFPYSKVESLFSKKQVSKEEFIDIVNDKFFSSLKESKANIPETDSLRNLGDLEKPNFPMQGNFTPVRLDSIPDLSKIELSPSLLEDLNLIQGNFLESAFLDQLDSIRNVNLSEQRISLKERQVTENVLITQLKEKSSQFDKVYFEGVLGVLEGDFTIVQASPALGYQITENLSLGLGPNLHIQRVEKNIKITAGLKSFAKVGFLKQRAYLQAEDIMNSFAGSEPLERKMFIEKHSIFVGGGYMFPLIGKTKLNFSVLYRINNRINNDGIKSEAASPWVVRIGLSSAKSKNEKKWNK